MQNIAQETVGDLSIRAIRHGNDAWLRVQHALAPNVICLKRFGPFNQDVALDAFNQVVERSARRQAIGGDRDG